MTTNVKVSVNGNYEATAIVNGGEPVIVGPGEEKVLNIPHPVDATITITERWLGAPPPEPQPDVG